MRSAKLLTVAVVLLIPAAGLYWNTLTGSTQALLTRDEPIAASADAEPQSAPSGKPAAPAPAKPAAAGTQSAQAAAKPATAPPPTTPTAAASKPTSAASKPAPAPAKPAAVATPNFPASAKAPALQAAVTKAMAGFPGRYSVVVHDLKTGQRWAVGEQERYHPASTLKVPVALYALELHRAGNLGWNDLITYTEEDFESPGGGTLEAAAFGSQYTVQELVGRALRSSNNIAVNMLGRYLGWPNIRTWTQSIGAELYREADASPSATALSEVGWWLHLEKLSRVDPKKAELVLAPLREADYTGRIAAGLPKGVPFAHKYGSYDGSYHDAGWIMGDKPFLLVILTEGALEEEADAAIARTTAAIYQVMAQ